MRNVRIVICVIIGLLAFGSPADGNIVGWGSDGYNQVTNTPAGSGPCVEIPVP